MSLAAPSTAVCSAHVCQSRSLRAVLGDASAGARKLGLLVQPLAISIACQFEPLELRMRAKLGALGSCSERAPQGLIMLMIMDHDLNFMIMLRYKQIMLKYILQNVKETNAPGAPSQRSTDKEDKRGGTSATTDSPSSRRFPVNCMSRLQRQRGREA